MTGSRSMNFQDDNELEHVHTRTALGGRVKFRSRDDEDPIDWWFASTAIPLLSATFAPMANMLSIAALVVSWRNRVTDDTPYLRYANSVGYPDPPWCLNLNGASLACGFVGNIFLLCNFTRKIRYIVALPVTIFLFYVAAGILIGITIGMNRYDAPREGEVYSQGYWYAVIAGCLYMLNAMLLMGNMLGYFLGHYPQHFDLNDEQRNLILQTMIFFVWLAGGAAVFAQVEEFEYVDALYFCDVTLLTIGFGDFVVKTNAGRGIVFPYTVGGTIILGLLVSSIHKFARELSKEKVVKKHVETRRVNTLRRAVTIEPPSSSTFDPTHSELRNAISRPLEADQIQQRLDEKAEYERALHRTIDFSTPTQPLATNVPDGDPAPTQLRFQHDQKSRSTFRSSTLERVVSLRHRIPPLLPSRTQKVILMRSEKDRFDKMRDIQHAARRFKKWYGLFMAVVSFGLLWCIGAVAFWQVEADTQQLTYFEALYFCYVSLLTVGYGDLSPRSNAGKPIFVLWSLIAVPLMTILISSLGDTAIGGFKRKVLEYGGLAFLGKGRGWGLDWFMKKKDGFQRRLSHAGITHHHRGATPGSGNERGINADGSVEFDDEGIPQTIDELANEELTPALARQRLASALQRVADDLKRHPNKRYKYEEWVEFTRLIRFTKDNRRVEDTQDPTKQLEYDEAVEGIIEWDWLDENSPMASEQTEAEWVMDRLLETLVRSSRKQQVCTCAVHTSSPVEVRPQTGSTAVEYT